MSSRRYFSRSPDRTRPSRQAPFSNSHRSSSNISRYYDSRHGGRNISYTSNVPSNYPLGSQSSRGATSKSEVHTKESSGTLSLNELPAREKLLVPEVLDAEENAVVEKAIEAFKSRGHFDEFRKDFMNGIEQLVRITSLNSIINMRLFFSLNYVDILNYQ